MNLNRKEKCFYCRKTIAFFVLVCYGTQIVLGSQIESNFWKERQDQIKSKGSAEPRSLLAALPEPLTKTISYPISRFEQKWSDQQKNNLPQNFKPVLNSISLLNASVQEIYNSKMTDVPPLLLIQDIHLNFEAQTNIAAVLQELINQKEIDLIGVEGAIGPFDFSRFRSFPNKAVTKKVMDLGLKKNLLAGVSYVGITSPTNPP